MELFFNVLISAIIQVLLFSLLPFIWWLITARKKEKYLKWIGIKKIENKKQVIIYSAITFVIFIILSIFILYSVKGIETATSKFYGLGFSAFIPVIIYSFIQTAGAEEILFRGFLLKRISNKFGFIAGNIIQSVMFGIMHGIAFFSVVSPIKAIIIILFTGIIGYIMGYINEKKANGSIIPSWTIHGLSNLFSSIVALYSLI